MALRYPLLTIILILLTLAAVGFLKVFKKINKGTYFVGNLKTFKSKTDNSLKNTVRNLTKYAQIGFLTVAIFSLILLTSRPTRNINNSQKSGGIDIMVSLDMSRSMFEEDFKPNRLEASTKVINDFIEKLESDRIGLVLFAGNTYALSPLTFDYSII